MISSLSEIEGKYAQYFSLRAFGYGLAFFTVISLVVLLWVWMNADKTLREMQSDLPSATVLIEQRTFEPAAKASQNMPDATSDAKPEKHALEKIIDRQEEEKQREAPVIAGGMKAAPLDGLVQRMSYGPLPVIRQRDGLTPFHAYKRPFEMAPVNSTNGVISIVISGLGLSAPISEKAVTSLPADITFALSPYALDPDFWREQARADGHEIWLGLPMETRDPFLNDTGPLTLLTDSSVDTLKNRILTTLATTTGYAGVVTTRDTIFYSAELEAREAIKNIHERGLGYVDASTEMMYVPQSVAVSYDAPYAHADLWIDDVATEKAIRAKLDELKTLAAQRGYAVGFADARNISIEEIARWSEGLENEGFALAPLSAQLTSGAKKQ